MRGKDDGQRHEGQPYIHSLFYADEGQPGKRKRLFPPFPGAEAVEIPHKSAFRPDFEQSLTARVAFLKWPESMPRRLRLSSDIRFESALTDLIWLGIVGFFRFHFKYGFSVIRCGTPRI